MFWLGYLLTQINSKLTEQYCEIIDIAVSLKSSGYRNQLYKELHITRHEFLQTTELKKTVILDN